MTANELRIGNKVFANGLHGGKIMTIEEIGGRGTLREEKRVIHFQEHPTGEFLKHCEPIPLTPEILEKCGYKKYGSSGEENGYYSLGTLSLEVSEPLPELKFLHQLQNLFFALTGEELKININKESVLEG